MSEEGEAAAALDDAVRHEARDPVPRVLEGEAVRAPRGLALERVAAALMLTLPGVPNLCVGRELGAPQPGEPLLESASNPSRLDFLRRLIGLRHAEPALSTGELIPLGVVGGDDRVHAYARVPRREGRPVLVVLNFGDAPATVRVRLSGELASTLRGRRDVELLGRSALRRRGAELRLHLDPHEAAAWAFDD